MSKYLSTFLMAFLSLVMFVSPVLMADSSSSAFVVPLAGPSAQAAGLHLVSAGQDGLEVVLDVPAYTLKKGAVGWQFSIPGLEQSSQPGEPRLPFASALIALPPGASVSVELLSDDGGTRLEGYDRIESALGPAPLDAQGNRGGWQAVADSAVYRLDQRYPAVPARVVDDSWLRELRVARLELYPVQYNPVSGTLFLRRHLRVAVHFEGGIPLRAAAAPVLPDAFDSTLQQSVLNYTLARTWRQVPAGDKQSLPVDPYSLAAVAQQSSGPRYKITVDQDGIYRLSYTDLQAAGLDVENLDPRQFRLSSQWQDIPIYVAGEADGDFTSDEYILFYGQKFAGERMASMYPQEDRNWYTYTQQLDDGSYALWHPDFNADMAEKYTDETVYWLTVEPGTWPRMAEIDGDPTGSSAPIAGTFTETIHTERSQYSRMPLPLAEDDWYYLETSGVGTFNYTTTLPSVASGAYTATIEGVVASYYSNDDGSPDHHTRFRLNSYAPSVDNAYWDGRSAHDFQAEIPQTALLNGTNTLYLDTYSDALVSYPRFMLDWFDITYQRLFQAASDRLAFGGVSAAERRYQVSGLSAAAVQAYEITDPFAPRRILNPAVTGSGSYTATFALPSSAGRRYLVLGPTAIRTPKSISFYDPPSLRSSTNGVDYLFIAPTELLAATQQFADYRASQGFDTQVITLTDVVNEFNDGIFHPIAIKNFLAYTFASWSKAPTYVVLVGDGSHDWKRFNPTLYGTGPLYMPPNQAWVDPWQGDTDATNALGTVVGTDVLPDVILARMSVNDVTQLATILQKTEDYEAATWQPWQQHLLFAADNADQAGDFEQTSDEVISHYVEPGFQADKLYVSQYCSGPGSCPGVGTAFLNQLNNTAALFVDYNGHGAPSYWAAEYVMRTTFIPSLTNGGRLPILLSMTCLDGFWFRTSLPSLAEEMVRTSGKGAVATFSPTGLGLATGHDHLQDGFFGAVFQQGEWTLGPATLAAKLNLYAAGSNYDLIQTFVIFGDPALRIPDPYHFTSSPATSAGATLAGEQVSYPLTLTNAGVLTDTFTLQVSGNTWAVDAPQQVGPLPAGESATFPVTVTVPGNVVGGTLDTAVVEVTSQGDHSDRAEMRLNTTGHTLGLALSPDQGKIGLPDAVVNYTLQVTNTGSLPDVYAISLGPHTWTANAPAATPSLGPGASASILISVHIPAGTGDHQQDVLPVMLTSQTLSTKTASALLTTTARTYGVSVSPSFSAAQGLLGAVITYTLDATNAGGYIDTLDVSVSGNAWPVNPQVSFTGPLAPGESVPLVFTVHIPTGIPGGMVDEAVVRVSSQHAPASFAEATLSTTSQIYGLTVWPAQAAQVALPGQVVTYTLQVTNTSSTSDTFSIAVGAAAWQTEVVANTGLIGSGASLTLPVVVHIPSNAADHAADSVTLTFTSQTDPSRMALAQLTTTARLFGVQLSPATAAAQAFPAETITYTLVVTNSGGFADTFAVSITGASWPTLAVPASVGALAPGQTAQLEVIVTIPPGLGGNSVDTALVTVTSQGDPQRSATSTLTTRSGYRVYLPLARK